LEECELELFIKSQLISFEISDEKSKNKTHKHTYKYNYNNSLLLCKPVYLKLCEISDYLLSTLQNHLQLNGLTKRIHGNAGHVSKTESRVFLDYNITFPIKQFLTQYGAIYRFPSPLRHQDDSGVFIYLLTSQTYTLYEMIPNLRFQPPASDLCEVCTSFKAKLLAAKQD
ncbi:22760_t:CDS:2, partial [Dentiscutata erythropus]